MLDDLLKQILLVETKEAVGERAVAGVLAHLIVAAAGGDKAELTSWLHDPERFARWRQTVAGTRLV